MLFNNIEEFLIEITQEKNEEIISTRKPDSVSQNTELA